MADWLVVVGLSVLIMATLGLLKRAGVRGQSVVLFLLPLAGLRQVRENWDSYGGLALLRVLGAGMALAGLALTYVRHSALLDDPFRSPAGTAAVSSAVSFVGSPRAALLMAQGDGKPLQGRVHGNALGASAQVSLTHGILSIEQGGGLLPERSISILLGWDPDDLHERRTLLVTPGSEHAPEIHVSWTAPGQDHPATQIHRHGYRLELALAPLDNHRLGGTIQLVLPGSAEKSYVVGDFIARTSHLHFLPGGTVDLFFDHPDTLAYVAEQYLKTQYPVGVIQGTEIESVDLQRGAGSGEVRARVALDDGSVEWYRMDLLKSEVGWAVTPGSDSQLLVQAQREGERKVTGRDVPPFSPGAARTAAAAASPTVPAPRHLASFSALSRYLGQPLTLVDTDGRRTEGRLLGVGEAQLRVRIQMGAGSAEIRRTQDSLAAVVLADGRRLTWSGPSQARTGAHPSMPALAAERGGTTVLKAHPASKEETASAGWQVMIGQKVVVRLQDGTRYSGILRGVAPDHVTLAVPMGAGAMEYFFDSTDVAAIRTVIAEVEKGRTATAAPGRS